MIACTPALSAGEDFLQGSWYHTGTLDKGGLSYYIRYVFHRGRYAMSGYPPIHHEGTYHIEKETSDSISLKLHREEDKSDVKKEFRLNQSADTISDGEMVFRREKPSGK